MLSLTPLGNSRLYIEFQTSIVKRWQRLTPLLSNQQSTVQAAAAASSCPSLHASPLASMSQSLALQAQGISTRRSLTALPASQSPSQATNSMADEPQHATAADTTDTGMDIPGWMQRTSLLLGSSGVKTLAQTRVLVVGLGGVGSFVCEFLVRAGIGHLTIVDGDSVDVTNKNRQLPATDSTVGLPKSQVVAARLRDINPQLNLTVVQEFLTPQSTLALLQPQSPPVAPLQADSAATQADSAARPASSVPGIITKPAADASHQPYEYVIDCIDSIATKLTLLAAAHEAGMHVVSSMGAGGRMDPTAVRVVDIAHTFGDPFAANIRRGLRKSWGIGSGITCVFSTEPVKQTSLGLVSGQRFKRSYYGTISYIPGLFGLHIAAYVINHAVKGPMLASMRALQRGTWQPPRGRSGEHSSKGAATKEARKEQGVRKMLLAKRRVHPEAVGEGSQGTAGDSSLGCGQGAKSDGLASLAATQVDAEVIGMHALSHVADVGQHLKPAVQGGKEDSAFSSVAGDQTMALPFGLDHDTTVVPASHGQGVTNAKGAGVRHGSAHVQLQERSSGDSLQSALQEHAHDLESSYIAMGL